MKQTVAGKDVPGKEFAAGISSAAQKQNKEIAVFNKNSGASMSDSITFRDVSPIAA